MSYSFLSNALVADPFEGAVAGRRWGVGAPSTRSVRTDPYLPESLLTVRRPVPVSNTQRSRSFGLRPIIVTMIWGIVAWREFEFASSGRDLTQVVTASRVFGPGILIDEMKKRNQATSS